MAKAPIDDLEVQGINLADDDEDELKSDNSDTVSPEVKDNSINQSCYVNGEEGYLLIINAQETSKGTEADIKNLKKFFREELQFKVNIPKLEKGIYLSRDEAFAEMEKVRTELDERYYCFICVIMSSGSGDMYFLVRYDVDQELQVRSRGFFKTEDLVGCGATDAEIWEEDIREFFNTENTPNFNKRPKLIVMKTCRGNKKTESGDHKDMKQRRCVGGIPTDADILFAFATTPGTEAMPEENNGTWFIIECINAFKKYHNKGVNVEDMLVTVRQSVASKNTTDGAKQMPCVWSTLTRRLLLRKSNLPQPSPYVESNYDPVYVTPPPGSYDVKDNASKNPDYYMDGEQGYLLIVNSRDKREGNAEDIFKLKTFFKDKLHFKVYDPRSEQTYDLSRNDIFKKMDEVRNQLDESYYCFICVIMSHGSEHAAQIGISVTDGNCFGGNESLPSSHETVTRGDGYSIRTKYLKKGIGITGDEIPEEEIREYFKNEYTPNFKGRPKLFLIQSCRGAKTHVHVTDGNHGQQKSGNFPKVPSDADTLFAFSTTPGYAAFRHEEDGSWFITDCITVFDKYYNRLHVEDMLITIRQRVAYRQTEDGDKQMPCIWSTLTRRLMLRECKG